MPDQRRILIVDDNEPLAENILEILVDDGLSGAICSSGREALARLERDAEFDLVVTDLRMPGMSGVELAARIRRGWPRLPVIMFSAYVDDTELGRARDAGVKEVLRKPEDVGRLIERAKQAPKRTGRAPRD